jgi:hypothetical protein
MCSPRRAHLRYRRHRYGARLGVEDPCPLSSRPHHTAEKPTASRRFSGKPVARRAKNVQAAVILRLSSPPAIGSTMYEAALANGVNDW